ncbi:MAG TPA: prepilin-type N-terminal cleavage/methylation domain-containing protein [Nitrospiraceae bacterium]|nr:prepilin-type N-terminal cleavage/methylation domain-containing protein [Nitrospiraceae bacterium]
MIRGEEANGFTMIELMIVVSIVGILATLAVPSYQGTLIRAREAALRQDLFTMRDVLDQHRADQGKYPPSLQALVGAGYLRAIPSDPFTNSATTWQEITGTVEEGVADVFSGSDLVGSNGVPYNRW